MIRRAILMAATLLSGLSAAPASAQVTQTAADPTGMLACGAITDAARRLACFDAALPALRAHLGAKAPVASAVPPVPATQAAPVVAAAPPGAQEQFGKIPGDDSARPQQADVDFIESTLTGFAVNGLGFGVLQLANGQIWQQTDTRAIRVKPAGQRIRIEISGFGGYRLNVEGVFGEHRVKRIR